MLEGSIAFTLSGATNSKFKALFSVWLPDYCIIEEILIFYRTVKVLKGANPEQHIMDHHWRYLCVINTYNFILSFWLQGHLVDQVLSIFNSKNATLHLLFGSS